MSEICQKETQTASYVAGHLAYIRLYRSLWNKVAMYQNSKSGIKSVTSVSFVRSLALSV